MPSYSNKYASSVVVIQESTSSRPSSSRSMSSSGGSRSSSSSQSMGSSTAYTDKYRSPASSGYYANVKESKSRKGTGVVVINHKGRNTAKGEPSSSEYSNSGGSRSSRS